MTSYKTTILKPGERGVGKMDSRATHIRQIHGAALLEQHSSETQLEVRRVVRSDVGEQVQIHVEIAETGEKRRRSMLGTVLLDPAQAETLMWSIANVINAPRTIDYGNCECGAKLSGATSCSACGASFVDDGGPI